MQDSPIRPTVTLPILEAALEERLLSRTACVGVIGLGYVGLPLSLLLSQAGFTVTGFDVDRKKVDCLENGQSYILRISPDEILLARSQGFSATADFARLSDQDAILLCIPTPLTAHHEPDMSYIENTARALAPWLHAGQLVVLESTTYPGTTQDVLIPLLEAGAPAGLKAQTAGQLVADNVFYVAYSPEREDPGNTRVERRHIPKVIGGHEPIAARLAAALYSSCFERTVPVSSTQVAEMTKLLENIYRCVNVALVNELKMLAMRMKIDIWEVIEAASTKPFGFQPFYPGPGLGGHCIPIDPFYLSWKAREHDFHTHFIELAGEVNEAMPRFIVQEVAKALNTKRKSVNGSKILILGMSYKKDVDDLRESPSLVLIELLREEGAEVAYNDPYHPTVGRGRHYNLNMASTPLDRLEEFDCVLIATDHSIYDYAELVSRAQLVVDSRNATRGLVSDHIFRC